MIFICGIISNLSCPNVMITYFRLEQKITKKLDIQNPLISLIIIPKYHFYDDKICVLLSLYYVPVNTYSWLFEDIKGA